MCLCGILKNYKCSLEAKRIVPRGWPSQKIIPMGLFKVASIIGLYHWWFLRIFSRLKKWNTGPLSKVKSTTCSLSRGFLRTEYSNTLRIFRPDSISLPFGTPKILRVFLLRTLYWLEEFWEFSRGFVKYPGKQLLKDNYFCILRSKLWRKKNVTLSHL